MPPVHSVVVVNATPTVVMVVVGVEAIESSVTTKIIVAVHEVIPAISRRVVITKIIVAAEGADPQVLQQCIVADPTSRPVEIAGRQVEWPSEIDRSE
jgi:hypothetical protein